MTQETVRRLKNSTVNGSVVLFPQDDSEDGFDKPPSEKDDFDIYDLVGSLKREKQSICSRRVVGRATPSNSR